MLAPTAEGLAVGRVAPLSGCRAGRATARTVESVEQAALAAFFARLARAIAGTIAATGAGLLFLELFLRILGSPPGH